ncbi:MAG: MBL fold metallo-hydrolase [Chloroflexi bacterium]|nr:MBL fold metallo-hydrolase [Chloroflexota bacterium]
MPAIDMLLQGFTFGCDQGGGGLCGVYLIRGRQTVLVDNGYPGRRRQLIDAFQRRGLSYDDIDTMVITHCHWDHILNLDMFPKARVIVHADELAYAQSPKPGDWAVPGYAAAMLKASKIETIKDEVEIIEGVRTVNAPGHSVGHIALAVETADGRAIISGDALPSTRSLSTKKPALVMYDEQVAARTIDRLIQMGQVFYPGHDRPFRLVNGVPEYIGPTLLRINTMLEATANDVVVTLSSEAPMPMFVLPR